MLEKLISSRVRAKLLTALFLSPGAERNAWELARSLGENYSAVWRELNRLEELGIFTRASRGNAIYYQVNTDCSIAPELRSIVVKSEGIVGEIQKRLREMPGVKEASIFGSFASGEADERSDIDLMVIGEVHLDELSPLITEAERELNRPISYVIYSVSEWEEKLIKEEPFAMNVNQAPKIMLVGEDYAL